MVHVRDECYSRASFGGTKINLYQIAFKLSQSRDLSFLQYILHTIVNSNPKYVWSLTFQKSWCITDDRKYAYSWLNIISFIRISV